MPPWISNTWCWPFQWGYHEHICCIGFRFKITLDVQDVLALPVTQPHTTRLWDWGIEVEKRECCSARKPTCRAATESFKGQGGSPANTRPLPYYVASQQIDNFRKKESLFIFETFVQNQQISQKFLTIQDFWIINIHNYIWKYLFVWPDQASLIHLWGKMSVVGCACNKCVQQVSLLELDTDHVTQGGRVCRRLSLTNKGRPCKVHVVTKTSIWPRQLYLVFWNDAVFFKVTRNSEIVLKGPNSRVSTKILKQWVIWINYSQFSLLLQIVSEPSIFRYLSTQ